MSSSHQTQNFGCGDGGSLILKDPRDVDLVNRLNKDICRRSFMLGQVRKDTWVETGSSVGLPGFLTAFLVGQLRQRSSVMARREVTWRRFGHRRRPVAEAHSVECMKAPFGSGSSAQMYALLLPSRDDRPHAHPPHHAANQIDAIFHYVQLHSAPATAAMIKRPVGGPATDEILGRPIRRPFHTSLDPGDRERICVLVEQWIGSRT